MPKVNAEKGGGTGVRGTTLDSLLHDLGQGGTDHRGDIAETLLALSCGVADKAPKTYQFCWNPAFAGHFPLPNLKRRGTLTGKRGEKPLVTKEGKGDVI